MTQDIVAARLEPPAETPVMRCADAARMRGEPLAASAAPYRRFLLLEVPGPGEVPPWTGSTWIQIPPASSTGRLPAPVLTSC